MDVADAAKTHPSPMNLDIYDTTKNSNLVIVCPQCNHHVLCVDRGSFKPHTRKEFFEHIKESHPEWFAALNVIENLLE